MLEIKHDIVSCSLESQLKNVSVGLDVDLTLFRREAIAGTSDSIDHRRIYATPEQNKFTLSHFMTVESYLYVLVFILCSFYGRRSYLWFYMYIYSIIVLRNTSLFLSFLLWTLFLSVCFMHLCLTIARDAYLYICVLNVGDYQPFDANAICLTMYRL